MRLIRSTTSCISSKTAASRQLTTPELVYARGSSSRPGAAEDIPPGSRTGRVVSQCGSPGNASRYSGGGTEVAPAQRLFQSERPGERRVLLRDRELLSECRDLVAALVVQFVFKNVFSRHQPTRGHRQIKHEFL